MHITLFSKSWQGGIKDPDKELWITYLWDPFGRHKAGHFYYRQASLGKLIDKFNFYICRNDNLGKH